MRGCGRNDGAGQARHRIKRQDRHTATALTGNGEMPGQTALSVRIENGKVARPGAARRGVAIGLLAGGGGAAVSSCLRRGSAAEEGQQ